MIRVRFVQEYRGRRIVTNGKMYGIEGDLVTDCRYLNVVGARAAIDSELGVAEHRRNIERGRDAFADYAASEGRAHRFACSCGWRGGYGDVKDAGESGLALRCPTCKGDNIHIAVGEPDE